MAEDLKPLLLEIQRGNNLTQKILNEERGNDEPRQRFLDNMFEIINERDLHNTQNKLLDKELNEIEKESKEGTAENIAKALTGTFKAQSDVIIKSDDTVNNQLERMIRGLELVVQASAKVGQILMQQFTLGLAVSKGEVLTLKDYSLIEEKNTQDLASIMAKSMQTTIPLGPQDFAPTIPKEKDTKPKSAKEEAEKDAAAAEKGMFKRLSESFTSGFKGLKDGFNNLTDSILGKAGVATAVLALGAFLVAKFPDLAEAVGDVTKAFVKLFKSGGRLFDPEDDYGFFDFFNENFYIFLAGFAYAFKNKIKALIKQLVIFSFNAIKKLFKKVILRGILTALVAGIGTAVGVSGGLVVGIAALIAGVVGAIIGAVMGLFDEFTREYKASGSVLKALGAGFLGILKGMLAGVLYVLEAIISFFTFGLLDFDLSSIIMDFDIGGAVRSLFSSISGYFENFSITDPSTWLGGNEPEGKFLGGPVASGTPYMVGEQGMELFVPGAAGSIIPNNMLGGGAPIIVTNNNISAPTNNSSHQHSNISITDNQQEIVGL